jgi:hypothetical protein
MTVTPADNLTLSTSNSPSVRDATTPAMKTELGWRMMLGVVMQLKIV